MKKITLILIATFTSVYSFAQLLPKPSPLGKVSQVVGATEVSLEYSRPGVKERKIFGELLPYGQIWRLGANSCTKITAINDLKFNGKELKAGTYSLFAIPKENGTWEIAFNTDIKQSGTASYSAEKDVFRLTAKTIENSFTETLYIGFDNVTETSAHLVVLWENIKVAVPFTVNTKKIALKKIDDAIAKGEKLEDVYYNAANYHFNSLKDDAKALKLVNKSIKIKKGYRNQFLKALILAKDGKKSAAIPLAKDALKLAKVENSMGYANYISSKIDEWTK